VIVTEPQYVVEQIADALAQTSALGELDVHARVVGTEVFLQGRVATAARREQVGALVAQLVPDYRLHNDVKVIEPRESTEPEHLS
jgi:hypothetical protein